MTDKPIVRNEQYNLNEREFLRLVMAIRDNYGGMADPNLEENEKNGWHEFPYYERISELGINRDEESENFMYHFDNCTVIFKHLYGDKIDNKGFNKYSLHIHGPREEIKETFETISSMKLNNYSKKTLEELTK